MTDEHAIDVYAFWNQSVWMYVYLSPCPICGRIHRHGGGNGPVPDLAVGEAGGWGSHCLEVAIPVTHRLVKVYPRDGKAAVKDTARAWRERTYIPCPVCPPHTSGELTKHKTADFHREHTRPCDVCLPLRPGVPRRHRVERRNPRRAVRHTIEVSS